MGNWTNWLIVIAVVALAVGPVMMFQPSAGQKKLARLRALANQAGIRVTLATKAIPELAGTACYALPWIDRSLQRMCWQLVRKSYTHELHINDVWAWQLESNVKSVAQVLQRQSLQLPEGVMSVVASPAGLGVYWSEKGSDKDLTALLAWLRDTQLLLK